MLPDLLAQESVTVLEPVMVDDRGTLVPDWTQPPASSTTIAGCSVQPATSTEDMSGRQQVAVRWSVWLPPASPVTAYSAVLWGGVRHLVMGEPARWTDPLGNYSHMHLEMEVWHG